MSFEKPDIHELLTESDVEQKLVMPLLMAPRPHGLGFERSSILTKANIRSLTIGKGKEQKLYYPDYAVMAGGFPVFIVEAKKPGEDLDDAYREARLYAAELNASFPSGTNPVALIMATDGPRIIAGASDDAIPSLRLGLEDLNPASEKLAELIELCGTAKVERVADAVSRKMRPARYWKPRRLVGGASIQQEEIGHNSFGATISADFAHIFNPVSQEDRSRIARDGYIPSRRRERYVEPIDRVIRAAVPSSEARAKAIEDTGKPAEIIRTLRSERPLEHQVLLIIGGAGVGKTTFIDHLRHVSLPGDLRGRTLWINLNMNVATVSPVEIYGWVRRQIVSECQSAFRDIDFDELDTLKALYGVEVNKFRKGRGRLYSGAVYDEKLADYLGELEKDEHLTAQAYARWCSAERGKLLVIVFDNCDKRNLSEQLLMFEVAQWLQREFRALVVLPLRDETYDNHRDRPPLDTALKDLVFRIEPPLFQRVLL